MAKRILVVEDENDLSVLLRLILKIKQSDWELLSATTGPEAIQRTQEFKPDLILLDIMLPEMNGIQVCQQLRDDPKWSKTKIVMLTALADAKTRRSALEAGADDYWTKPVMPDDLLSNIQEVLA
jgi:DNA-binding response OmpR family regulator